MRIALAKILLSRPDFAILDEPTNHLDIHARKWLADYLSSVSHGFIVVSHDRYFLDHITDHIVEIRGQKLHHYTSNYTRFLELREERIQQEEAAASKTIGTESTSSVLYRPFWSQSNKSLPSPIKKETVRKLGDIQVQDRIWRIAHTSFSRSTSRSNNSYESRECKDWLATKHITSQMMYSLKL